MRFLKTQSQTDEQSKLLSIESSNSSCKCFKQKWSDLTSIVRRIGRFKPVLRKKSLGKRAMASIPYFEAMPFEKTMKIESSQFSGFKLNRWKKRLSICFIFWLCEDARSSLSFLCVNTALFVAMKILINDVLLLSSEITEQFPRPRGQDL